MTKYIYSKKDIEKYPVLLDLHPGMIVKAIYGTIDGYFGVIKDFRYGDHNRVNPDSVIDVCVDFDNYLGDGVDYKKYKCPECDQILTEKQLVFYTGGRFRYLDGTIGI